MKQMEIFLMAKMSTGATNIVQSQGNMQEIYIGS